MQTNILRKPKGFYDEFTRKGVADVKSTHYCPGCGHGIIHKLIAEAIEDFEINNDTIIISPVGCSVFAYYYFDTGNIQAAHGRAPAVATGAKRANSDSIVISYQGDGDLAAIGTAEIIHAANRGENICVFFVNNAIYGMTGGQMAPTTLIGQKTLTSPHGRSVENEGYPIKMAEMMNQLEAPIYIERVALTDAKHINKTKKAIRKALQNQIDKKGFSFVEILTPCPTNWKMTPSKSKKWVEEVLMDTFKVDTFRDNSEDATPRVYEKEDLTLEEFFKTLNLVQEAKTQDASLDNFPEQNMKIAGFGGQGVLSAGIAMSIVGMEEGLNVSWIPSYGPEMRGGTANCSVRISTNRIGSPLVENPNVLITMNGPSLDTFENDVVPGGFILVNSSLVDRKVKRDDVKTLYIPVTDMAAEIGLRQAANMVALGAYLAYTKILDPEKLSNLVTKAIKKKEFVEINIKAIQAGAEFAKKEL
ncbi:MAG: 2-oxoacid:acceptor oxidoreductase family protein [Pseudomonadota bacterium]